MGTGFVFDLSFFSFGGTTTMVTALIMLFTASSGSLPAAIATSLAC